MSGTHWRFEVLRWPLPDESLVKSYKSQICIGDDMKRKGWAYPACVYTDDPMYDCPPEKTLLGGWEYCYERGICAYKFVINIEAFARKEQEG